jgi:hypothetical protein
LQIADFRLQIERQGRRGTQRPALFHSAIGNLKSAIATLYFRLSA